MNPQPKFQSQENKIGNLYIETDACCSFAATNSIASQIIKLTGSDPDLSPRYVAKLSNTGYPGEYPPPNYYGNSVSSVISTIQKYGMVSNSDWPTAGITSDAEFYAEIPAEVIAKGRLWLQQWTVEEPISVQASQVASYLLKAPLLTEIVLGSPTDNPATGTAHLVCQLTETTYFDSIWGQPAIKSFIQPPINYTSLLLTSKTMPQIISLNLQGTEGIFLEASTPEEYQALCLIFGKDPSKPDKTI